MSSKKKNFHYHYAEQYETREQRAARREKRRFPIPPVAMIISLVMLVLFGLISMTFSVYVTTSLDDPEIPKAGGLLVSVGNTPVRAETDSYGIVNKSEAIAQTGAEMNIVESAVNVDMVETGTLPTPYAIAGVDGDWTRTDMTVSDGGYYCYYEVTGSHSSGNQISFAILNSTTTWDRAITVSGFSNAYAGDNFWNSGAIYNDNSLGWSWANNPGDGDRIYFEYKNSKKIYIVVYFPNTELNTFTYPKITYYNTLPDDTADYYITSDFADGTNYVNTKIGDTSAGPGATYTLTATLPTANHTYHYRFYKDFSVTSYANKGNDTYSNNGTMTSSNCSGWNFKTNENTSGYAGITSSAAINGSYSFSVTDTSWHDNSSFEQVTTSVTYPTYHTVSRYSAPSNGALFLGDENHSTPTGTSSVNVFEGRTYYARAVANENYQIKTFTVGGVSVSDAIGKESYTYTGTMGSSDVTVSVTYKEKEVPHFQDNTFSNVSKTVNDTANFNVTGTVLYHSSGTSLTASAEVTSGNSAEVVSCAISGGTVTVTAKITDKVGDTVITVSLKDGSTDRGSQSFTVSVATPSAVTFNNPTIEEKRTGTLTASVPSGAPAPTNYSWSTTATNISITDTTTSGASKTSVTILAGDHSSTSTNTAQVTLHATYASGYATDYTATVTIGESPYSLYGQFGNYSDWADSKLTYDADASSTYNKTLYSFKKRLDGNKDIEFVIRYANGSDYDYYKNNTTIQYNTDNVFIDKSGSGITFTKTNGSGNNTTFKTKAEGFYTIYYQPGVTSTTGKLYALSFPEDEYYLLGFGDWTKQESQKMTQTSAGSGVYTITKHFDAGQTYPQNSSSTANSMGFKIYYNNGEYYGYNGSFEQRNGNNTKTLATGTDNTGFKATYSGDYTFTFTVSSKSLTITYPTRSVTINALFAPNTNTNLGSVTLSNTTDETSNDYLTLKDNGNDTFTVTRNIDDKYVFDSWWDNDTSSASKTITVNNSTAVSQNTTWNYKGYKITLHNVNKGTIYYYGNHSATFVPQSDPTLYEGEYTYNTGLTLPTSADFANGTYSSYIFDGWYESPDYSGSPVTSIPATSTGDKEYWAKWLVRVEFRDIIRSSTENLITTQNVQVGGKVDTDDSTFTSDIASADSALASIGFEPNNTTRYSVNLASQFIDGAWIAGRTDRNTIYVNYLPKAQNFTISITPDTGVTGTGTSSSDPFNITFGSKISVHAVLSIPQGVTPNSNIYYKWLATVNGKIVDGSDNDPTTYDQDASATSFTRDDIVTMMTKDPAGTYTLSAKAYFQTPSGDIIESTASEVTVYYKVATPLSSTVTYSPPEQLIYSSAPDITVNVTTATSITDANVNALTNQQLYNVVMSVFTTKIGDYDAKVATTGISGTKPNFIASFANKLTSLQGVLYPKFELHRPENITSGEDELDSSVSGGRLVIGSYQSTSTRPLYVKNNTATQLSSYRLMLFYVVNGSLKYQTAENVASSGELYRFEIPDSDSLDVWLVAYDKSKEYVLPTYDSVDDKLVFSATSDYVCKLDTALDVADYQAININSISSKTISAALDNL